MSLREIGKRLAAIGFKIGDIDAVLITHEHTDHVSGLPVLADDDATWDRLAESAGTAQTKAESAELLSALRRAIAEELTPRQRQVFVAVALNDVEIDVVAGRLQSTRGAVYKVLHDARTKLRGRLEREGHLKQKGER